MEDESTPKQILDDILYHLATDKDRDVRFYISDFISQEELELYQKKKAVEDLQVARDISKELESKALPPPPTLPAHLIMLPPAPEYEGISTVHQVLADLEEEDEEEEGVQGQEDGSNVKHEIEHLSADSPMEIVNDDVDIDIDPKHETKETEKQEEEKDVDEIMTDVMDTSGEEDHHLKEHFEDEEEEDDDNATEKKAQHIYLSKTPVHALNDTNMMLPSTSPTLTTSSTTTPITTTTASD